MPSPHPGFTLENPDTVVEVRNTGDVDYIDGFNSRRYRIPPGRGLLVDIDAVKLWVGDWTLRDVSLTEHPRADEVNRLRVRTGHYHDPYPLPSLHLELYSVDGDRIWTVLEDPEGEKFDDIVVSKDMEKEQLEQAYRDLKRRMEVMERLVAQANRDTDIDDVPSDAPDDDPGQADRPLPPMSDLAGNLAESMRIPIPPVRRPPGRRTPGAKKPIMPDPDQDR